MSYAESTIIKSPIEANGALPVNIQDQHTELVDLYFHVDEASFTFASAVTIGDTSFTATAGHGISIGDLLQVYGQGRLSQFEAINVVGDVITVDTPFDCSFTTECAATRGPYNLNLDGSSTMIEAHIDPPDGVEYDIVRIIIYIQDGTAMDDALFGGLTELTNGIVLRTVNGITKNIFNVKSNGELALRAYDTIYTTKAPAGSYGLRCRRTFGGQDKNGVTIRLNGSSGDRLQLLIQDDLTGLEAFKVVAQGHVVTG